MSLIISSCVLVLSNLVPLFGVLYLGWSLPAIIFLYWCENLIVGAFNILRITYATGTNPSGLTIDGNSADSMRPRTLRTAFVLNYGMFTFVHGVFILALFGLPQSSWTWFAISIFSLVASHGISYWSNFVQGGEATRVSPASQFTYPYQRLGILHLTIIAGALAAARYGATIAVVAVMVGLKITIDLVLHIREHRARRQGLVLTRPKYSITVPSRRDAIGMTVISGILFFGILFFQIFADVTPPFAGS